MKQQIKSKQQVPTIDLSNQNKTELISQISNACSTLGFFHVINHGIPQELVESYRSQTISLFDLPYSVKNQLRRNETNARGYFDNEFTKQKLDWKECLDVGVPGCRDWSVLETTDAETDDVDQIENTCLDGCNRFPDENTLPGFRSTVVKYFEACAELSDRIARLMELGYFFLLEEKRNQTHEKKRDLIANESKSLVECMRKNHTSYLRINHYPPCPESDKSKDQQSSVPLGISPHTDAGFLTVLMQDDGCHSLQVAFPKHHQQQSNSPLRLETKIETKLLPNSQDDDFEWITVKPVHNAFTINTGDMAMIWSNGHFRAPLHRVLTNPTMHRYSSPFFYNPGYSSIISPIHTQPFSTSQTHEPKTEMEMGNEIEKQTQMKNKEVRYHPCSWGYFRAVRFAGDLTNLGAEIQISDFEVQSEQLKDIVQLQRNGNKNQYQSHHITRQAMFLKEVDFNKPFSVEKYRSLLVGEL